jgi:hypothetical protein
MQAKPIKIGECSVVGRPVPLPMPGEVSADPEGNTAGLWLGWHVWHRHATNHLSDYGFRRTSARLINDAGLSDRRARCGAVTLQACSGQRPAR